MTGFKVIKFNIPNKPRIRIKDKTAIICRADNLPTVVDIYMEYVPSDSIAELDSLHRFFSEVAINGPYLLEEYAFTLYKEILSTLKPLELKIEVCGVGVGHGEACIEYYWKFSKENKV